MFDSYNNNDDFLNLSFNEQGFSTEENPFILNMPDNLLLQEGNPYSLKNSPLPSLHQGQLSQIPENQENSIQEDEKKNNIASEINDRLNIFEEEPNFKIGESFFNLEGNKENLLILDERNDIQKQNEKKVFNINSTAFTSKENGQKNPEKIVDCQKRIDYGQKYFKTKFSKFLRNLGNNIIQKSGLPANLQKKLSLPNHISFTGNSKEKDNYYFLSFTVQQIFGYYKNENCKNSLQKKNKTIIDEILAFIDKSGNEKYESIRDFFSMSLEGAYELYYESKDFKEYASDPKAIELDKEFRAQKKDSLLEKYGYIKMCKKFTKKTIKQ